MSPWKMRNLVSVYFKRETTNMLGTADLLKELKVLTEEVKLMRETIIVMETNIQVLANIADYVLRDSAINVRQLP